MKLSTKGRYGVKAMVDLAVRYGKEPVSIKTISERQNISEYYLEQLFSTLRKSGLIKSVRGAMGGYVLGKAPEEIRIYDILEVLEGPIEISHCLDTESCDNIDCCATRLVWKKIKDSIDNVTMSITLKDIVEDYMNISKLKGVTINHE
ncbi:MAG: Rrf2 family transcriptional regulator [Clostridium argentinense]|uniref:Rrf2 family transcriptional regulator n=1 Tax=Clostridium faecium TaxID=2762223 RepID=A0ABR8YPT8_9CLOT|nr:MULTISPECIES: Rrf2 family transcriptional regulator [Clostridium]MBD8046221.1 Rrf2 family transcriptional regulator [Clostridium faecium]MBS5825204.1 Rrf2 family transcriptional regulator [Clostridium argentinense]MDU1347753.1 Rrf2 family transcriptional regulator [Clostridium argentinense]